MLSWALGQRPQRLDPLLARTPADSLVSRQIHEPLVEALSGPFDDPRRLAGLALFARASSDNSLWRLRLRHGVRFQDGSPLSAKAVLANADRWRRTAVGRRLLPGLEAVDAPRPDLVRFILARPDGRFDRRLAAPRLGMVSPRALRGAGRSGIDIAAATDSGTGPFELRERDAERLLLVRNADWWGTEHELGPGIDQLEFLAVTDPGERLSLAREGSVQVAGGLGSRLLAQASASPLLTVTAPRDPAGLALERSVRGLATDEPAPSLNSVWRTTVGSG
jgi:MarR-like DNA-binding transcriptional regulator SgrR of sgrS sRNA